MRVAQYLLPEDTAALTARLAQITTAYEQLQEGVQHARAVAEREG